MTAVVACPASVDSVVSAGGRQIRFGGLVISPIRMALVETFTLTTRPSITARTRWMFGLNFRLLRPVILRPTPPRYLALPRRVIEPPARVVLPVK